jgi:hypothetical protein
MELKAKSFILFLNIAIWIFTITCTKKKNHSLIAKLEKYFGKLLKA